MPPTPDGGLHQAGASLSAHTQRQRNRSRREGLPRAPKNLKNQTKNDGILSGSFLSSFLSSFSPLLQIFITPSFSTC